MGNTDLIGPLPKSKRGNAFILVVSDYLSKFTLLFPLRKSSTETVIRHLENYVFMLFGIPRTLLCDNGPQFRSSKFYSSLRGMGLKSNSRKIIIHVQTQQSELIVLLRPS